MSIHKDSILLVLLKTNAKGQIIGKYSKVDQTCTGELDYMKVVVVASLCLGGIGGLAVTGYCIGEAACWVVLSGIAKTCVVGCVVVGQMLAVSTFFNLFLMLEISRASIQLEH